MAGALTVVSTAEGHWSTADLVPALPWRGRPEMASETLPLLLRVPTPTRPPWELLCLGPREGGQAPLDGVSCLAWGL